MTMQAVEGVRAPISIVIAVAVRLYREGLATALAAQAHVRIDRSVGTLADAHAAVLDLQPDVLIVDVSLEDACGMIRAIRQGGCRCRILAFAVREDIATILDYAEAGADGFVTANGSIAELIEAIEKTAVGELMCSPRIAAQLLRHAARPTDAGSPGAIELTGREEQVYSLLRQGLSNKEIASALGIAEATVKNHVHHVLEKLHVATRAQAVASGRYPLKATLGQPAPTRKVG